MAHAEPVSLGGGWPRWLLACLKLPATLERGAELWVGDATKGLKRWGQTRLKQGMGTEINHSGPNSHGTSAALIYDGSGCLRMWSRC